jgi:hypothetical protein
VRRYRRSRSIAAPDYICLGHSQAADTAKFQIPRQTLESKILRLGINTHRFKT